MGKAKVSKVKVDLSRESTAQDILASLNTLIPETKRMAGESALDFVLLGESSDRDSALMLSAKAQLMSQIVFHLSGESEENGLGTDFSVDDYL